MLIIGEKINIITKKIAKAIEEKDTKPIEEMAIIQVEAGANMLDVNIGPARKAGPEVMEWLVKTIQKVVDVPLCLDTTNSEATEAGLKVHKGKALINSTSAAPARMSQMLPLAKKYEASIIGLALAERGMPRDANERCAIVTDILMAAAEHGVPLEDIYLDPVVLPVNGMQEQAMQVIETIKMFQDLNDPPMKTVVGLSNISNGSPPELRQLINRTYLNMAINAGLTAAIVDPLEKDLMEEVKTVEVLKGNILYCHSYLET